MRENDHPLAGVRVLAALNGLELFGHERGNIEVYKAIQSLGAEVTVGVNAAEQGGDVGRHLRDLGFPTFLLPFHNQWSLMWLRREPASVVAKLRSVVTCSATFGEKISEWRPTHILLGNPLVYSYISIALAKSSVTMVYRMGDCPPVGSRFNLGIWRLAIRRASQVVANAEFVRRSAMSAGVPENRTSLIYALAPSVVAAEASNLEVLSMNQSSERRIVYVGSVSAHKGVRELVLAFDKVRARFPDSVLDVVGGSRYDVEFRDLLLRLVEEKGLLSCVFLHGKQADPLPFYRRAAVHVVPSIWDEPMANVVLEAKREGIPSVVFPSGGLPEVVRDRVDGVVCQEKTVDDLARAITWLLEDEERRRAAGRAARADFLARFGPERFAQQWAEVFLRSSRVRPRDPGSAAKESG